MNFNILSSLFSPPFLLLKKTAVLTMSVWHVLEAQFIHITMQPFFDISLSTFSKLLTAHTMSRMSDLLISSLRKLCKSSSSTSGTGFLHDQTSVTEFTEVRIQDMLYTASNTVISFHNAIILSSSSARVLRSAR
jgi:hypothetical protein